MSVCSTLAAPCVPATCNMWTFSATVNNTLQDRCFDHQSDGHQLNLAESMHYVLVRARVVAVMGQAVHTSYHKDHISGLLTWLWWQTVPMAGWSSCHIESFQVCVAAKPALDSTLAVFPPPYDTVNCKALPSVTLAKLSVVLSSSPV